MAAPTTEQKATEKATVKMKFTGIMKGNVKTVELPIPLVSTSQKLDEVLKFTRPTGSRGPLVCEVPLKWAGSLLSVGGNWKLNEEMTPELTEKIDKARQTCEQEMQAFAHENEMVDA